MNLGMLARVALLAALCAVGGTTVFAQLQSGRIVGTVFDPQRAGIPGATVTVTNLATNIARTVITDSAGNSIHADHISRCREYWRWRPTAQSRWLR